MLEPTRYYIAANGRDGNAVDSGPYATLGDATAALRALQRRGYDGAAFDNRGAYFHASGRRIRGAA